MTEQKFKPGMRVFHVTQGVVKLEEQEISKEFPVWAPGAGGFTADGKYLFGDKFPSLYTLEEARKMGFPVPKEPLRVECKVRWELRGVHVVPYGDGSFEFEDLIGRTGTLIFQEDEQ